MKAIETEYGGVLFRSRLEARWAVFFDALGIRWEYEPEAFRLSDGCGYTPDFWLSDPDVIGAGAFLEIKPEGGDLTKADDFARQHDGQVLGVAGSPADFRLWILGRCELTFAPAFFFACRFSSLPEAERTEEVSTRAAASVRAYRFWNPREVRR